MDNNKHSEFRQDFNSNLKEGSEPIDLDSEPYEDVLEDAADMELPYEEVLIDTETGPSFVYRPEEDEFEEITREASTHYFKEFVMEYQDGWRETDLDEAVPGAEAYMFRI